MAIDPDELKLRNLKRVLQFQQIKDYIEEKDELDKENTPGKMGPHEIKRESSIDSKSNQLLKKIKNITPGELNK